MSRGGIVVTMVLVAVAVVWFLQQGATRTTVPGADPNEAGSGNP